MNKGIDGVGLFRQRGLRVKLMVRFAAVAFMLSVLSGAITYLTVRQILLEDREASAIDQVTRDARLLSSLGSPSDNPSEVLASLRPPSRSTPMLLRNGQWFAASLQVRPEDLPSNLVTMVTEGQSAMQAVMLPNRPVLIVGTPLADGRSYFEVLSLADVEQTLTTLFAVLGVSGAITTVAGALLGGWIAGRVLQPLRDMTEAAGQVASGALDTRLDEALDRDLAELVASFNLMTDSLQARIAKEARFASDVAHELRTPLTTVVTSLAILDRRRSELSPEGAEALDLLARDVRRLERTAADLIELAKLDSGAASAELELHPAGGVITGVLGRLQRTDVPVMMDAESARSLVRVDERRLERVMSNLIDNADTHGGGVTAVTVSSGKGVVLVGVEDRGGGVPHTERDRIFERFARGERSTRRGDRAGSGLGLALAIENARLQGGRLWVEDVDDGGARFVVELAAEPA